MLRVLHVKNMALIEEEKIEFGDGLNILTGETGAGKSILIGSWESHSARDLSRISFRRMRTMLQSS